MIHCVIKGTTSVEQYKAVHQAMTVEAECCFQTHRAACEGWEHGEPAKVWLDGNGCLCVEYTDGQWWHYRDTVDGRKEWW